MSIYSIILSNLATQDDQGDDWYAWASNQLSHVLLGIVLSSPFFILNAALSNTIAAMVAVGALKKATDWYRETIGWRIVRDTIQDLAFFLLGLLFCFSLTEKSMIALGLAFISVNTLLILGVFGRIPKKEQ